MYFLSVNLMRGYKFLLTKDLLQERKNVKYEHLACCSLPLNVRRHRRHRRHRTPTFTLHHLQTPFTARQEKNCFGWAGLAQAN